MDKKADFLFEVSWEICNKVGGIYTVVKSKILPTKDYYGNNYYLIGPFHADRAHGEFEQKVPPDFLADIFKKLKEKGITCHYGVWLVSGTPQTILIDYHSFTYAKDQIKTELWNNFGVDSLNTNFYDFDVPLIWSYAVGMLIHEISLAMEGKKIITQCHEWLAGAALLYLKSKNAKVGTVFTTHATMLGRILASQNVNIYSMLDKINPEEEARKCGNMPKFSMERACAKASEVFTTVSEITALEAEHLLGRKPDVVLANGLDTEKFPTFDEVMIKHRFFRSKIRDFISFYFFPYYQFDLDKTLIFFTCARYEYHTKGLDVMIDALKMLNDRLKQENVDINIITFFWIPGNIRGIKLDIIENKTLYMDLKDTIEENISDIRERIMQLSLTNKKIDETSIFEEDVRLLIHQKLKKMVKVGLPPVCTHDLYDEQSDQILNGLAQAGLNNKAEDKVKVIFYPIYLTGADRLLDTAYYESMLGSHLGIFPSYYEPWGYTPFEAAALGCPSITTDLAGFGRFIAPKAKKKNPGIYVINRLNKDDAKVTTELANTMYHYTMLPKTERIQNKINARDLAVLADWRLMITHYIEAHKLALERAPC